MPNSSIKLVRRRQELQHLRDAMRRANVPEDAANQVIEDVKLVVYATGYVYDVYRYGSETIVTIKGLAGGDYVPNDTTEYSFEFPPNRAEHLAELIRAQSHPHLRVFLQAWRKTRTDPAVINDMHIVLDYYETPLDNAPPFDVRTLKEASPAPAASPAISQR